MRIIWSPLAIDRASYIADYIARDKPSAAENWINTVFSKVKQLASTPEIGRIVPEINDSRFRELIYGNYRIIYRVCVFRDKSATRNGINRPGNPGLNRPLFMKTELGGRIKPNWCSDAG